MTASRAVAAGSGQGFGGGHHGGLIYPALGKKSFSRTASKGRPTRSPRLHIPQLDDAVLVSRGEERAVGTECYGVDAVRTGEGRAEWPPRRHVPQPDGAVLGP